MMRRWFIVTCLLGGFASAASTTQPAATTQPVRAPFEMIRRMPPEQFAISQEFARQHMPNLYKLSTESPQWRRMHLMRYAFARMITYNQARGDFELSQKVAQDLQAEDEVFALAEHCQNASLTERPAIQDKLRGQMRQVLDNLLDERKDRLERLKLRLADEEKRLQDDRANRDAIVENRVENLLSDSMLQSQPSTNPSPTTAPAN